MLALSRLPATLLQDVVDHAVDHAPPAPFLAVLPRDPRPARIARELSALEAAAAITVQGDASDLTGRSATSSAL
jgi:hypothetical protein